MRRLIQFEIRGIKPGTAGSKNAVPYQCKATKKLKVRVFDNCKRADYWKQVVKIHGKLAWGGRPLSVAPLDVGVLFEMQRPKGHYGTGRNAGRVKPSAPLFPTVKPDVLKLMRGTEDALTGVIWKDDSQICNQRLRKRYADDWRVLITISELEEGDL